MTEIVESLRRSVERTGFTADDDAYEILAIACVACCLEINGGNKTCPPKTELLESA